MEYLVGRKVERCLGLAGFETVTALEGGAEGRGIADDGGGSDGWT